MPAIGFFSIAGVAGHVKVRSRSYAAANPAAAEFVTVFEAL